MLYTKEHCPMHDQVSTDAPTFWMNVTTSSNWHRSPVGIVRVEQEIRRHLGELLRDRLRTVVFKDGKLVPEAVGLTSRATDGDDFWPEPSYGCAADPFDPIQSAVPDADPARALGGSRKPTFGYGDVLITMGLDWDYPGLHDEIKRVAKAYNLTVIVCCYDLIPVLYPQYCVSDVAAWFKNYFIDMTWSADGVLCISENTRRDYLELADGLGLPPRRTEVIKLGGSLPPQTEGAPLSKEVRDLLDERFLLFVSTIERRKNHEVLYRAYHMIRKENPEAELPKLVFVGMEGWGVAELMSDIRLDPLTKGDIVILPQVSDSELSQLYARCEAFLYPSLYEGWGLPISEALQFGRPVLSSNMGSIPEVGGDLVRYLDPWSPREWANEILKIVNGETDLEAWSKQIESTFIPYEWSAAAKLVVEMANDLRQAKQPRYVIEPGYQLSTVNGVHYGGKIIYDGREGIVCHGPYVDFAAGSYEATVRINWVSGESGSLYFAARNNDGKTRLAVEKRDIGKLQPGEHEIRLAMNLTEDIHGLEFLCEAHCPGRVRFSIDEIVITRTGSSWRRSEPPKRVRAA